MKKSSITKKYLFLTYILAAFLSCQNAFAVNRFQLNTILLAASGQANANKYNRALSNTTLEYTPINRISFGTNIQGSYIDSEYKNGTNQFAFNSIEIWNRYRFYEGNIFRFTLQNLYKFPGNYDVNPNIGLGHKQQDYEIRLLNDYNMKEGLTNSLIHHSTPYLMRIEFAYRRRFDNNFNEARFNLTAAYFLNAKYGLLFQQSSIWNIYSRNTDNNNSAGFIANNNANNNAIFSTLYQLEKEIALQFGYMRKIGGNGKNYDSQGLLIGILASF